MMSLLNAMLRSGGPHTFAKGPARGSSHSLLMDTKKPGRVSQIGGKNAMETLIVNVSLGDAE